jgi:hypothetical protein
MGRKQTDARRDHRLPPALTDEQVEKIADAGTVPAGKRLLLGKMLRSLLSIDMPRPDAGVRELRRLNRRAKAALVSGQSEDYVRLNEALAALSPAARDRLNHQAGIRTAELPTSADLTAEPVSDETRRRVELLFGLTRTKHVYQSRGRGKPRDDNSGLVSQALGLIYFRVTGRTPTRGRGGRWSRFEEFLAKALIIFAWRSPDAEAPPKQARRVVDEIAEARRRRLKREAAASRDRRDAKNE